MKYDSLINRSTTKSVLYACFAWLLVGCGASSPVKELVDAEAAPQIVPTEHYLPVDQFDKEGIKLPYVPAENPYALQTGRIQKESVAIYIEARRAFKKGDYAQALKKLDTLINQDATLSGPLVMKGDIALKQNKTEEAEKQYRQAISINPDNVNAYLRLAHILRLQGKFIQSQNVYAKSLALWKDFPEAHLNLGILYDIYLNKPLAGQQHMEAFQFLSDSKKHEVTEWLSEIRTRTGVEYSIKAGAGAETPSLSIAGDVEK